LSREKLETDIAVAMGGRIAEEMIFGYDKVTSGASSDIKMATSIARSMVTQFGMSDELGPLSYNENEQEVFLGHSVTQTKNVSEDTSNAIDREVRRIVDAGYKQAKEILTENLDKLHRLANALLEYEALDGDEINSIIKGETFSRPDDREPPVRSGKRGTVPNSGEAGSSIDLEPKPQPGS
jgi:cell division protease FtsH